MKNLLIGILALTSSSVFAVDFLKETVDVLEKDYQMRCSAKSNAAYSCHDAETKLVGINLSISSISRGTKIKIEDFNNSKDELLRSNKAQDKRFWGRTLVTNLMDKIETAYLAECAELHENVVGKDSDYVFKPWWEEIVRTECFDSKGDSLNIKANLGQDGNFLKNIKIIK